MSLRRVAIPSPNYSSRGGSTVTTIVLHTAEGALTFQSLGSFFANPASGVSSHVGIDDTPATVGEYVPRSGKAWTAANANPWAVQAELCAFAAWTGEWSQHPTMLENTAQWIAEEAAAFGIPIVKLTPAQAQDPNARGVCQHVDLGSMGGGHWDCGPGFPFDHVLEMARSGAPAPIPPPGSGPSPGAGPPWPGVYLRDFTEDPAARTWQAQMSARGWAIDVDGMYGPASASICRQFQGEKGLAVDGVVGPDTWAATWSAPIT